MANNESVQTLLLRWKEMRDQGKDISPEDLCADRPDLIAQLREKIESLVLQYELEKIQADAKTLPLPPALSNFTGTIAYVTSEDSKQTLALPLPTIPGYDILEVLGRGGKGVVYKARQHKLNRIVALKMILSGSHAEEEEVLRFRREAEAIARLQHPNIVQIYEIGEHGGQPYFSLEYCDGRSLEKKLHGTPLPPMQAAKLLETLARTMHFAHEHKIIHRDLKPANILLQNDGGKTRNEEQKNQFLIPHSSFPIPKITDFGLAKRQDQSLRLTQDRALMGTPSYMSPEQACGEARNVGPASDIYSLGAVLYECLTGRPPFKAANPWETITQVLKDEPAPPRRLQSSVPRDLEIICLKCLEKDPRKRYATAQELADDLHHFSEGKPILARPVGVAVKATKWVKRRPAIASLLATIAILTVIGVVLLWVERNNALFEKNRADEAAQKAMKALAETARERDKAKFQALRADTALYAMQLKQVQSAYKDWKLGYALDILKNCSQKLRGWEYDYLLGLCQHRVQTLQGHDRGVFTAVFSPDFQRIASAGEDNSISIWQADTGKRLFTLEGHTDRVRSIAFSPDGGRLVSGSRDETIKIWNLDTGQILHTLESDSSVNSVAYRADGQQILSGESFRNVKLWNAQDGKLLDTFKGHSDKVLAVAFRPNSQELIAGDASGTIMIWDAAKKKPPRVLKGHSGAVLCLACSPDGQRLFSGSNDQTIKLWDAQSGKERKTFTGHFGPVTSLAVSTQDTRFVSGSADHTLKVWSAESDKESITIRGHKDQVMGVAVAFDQKVQKILSASLDKSVKIWNLNSEEAIPLPGHNDMISSLAFHPESKNLVSASLDKTARIWETATGKFLRELKDHQAEVLAITYSFDGRQIFTAGADHSIRIWEGASGRPLHTFEGHDGAIHCLSCTKNGKFLISSGEDQTIKIWDVPTWKLTHTYKGSPKNTHFLPCDVEGGLLVSIGQSKLFQIWKKESDQGLAVAPTHASDILCVAISRDYQLIATATADGLIRLWQNGNSPIPKFLDEWTGHDEKVFCVAFHPQGKRLASACADSTVKIWDTATGLELLTLEGHLGIVNKVIFSPDGQYLATAGKDKIIKIWAAPGK